MKDSRKKSRKKVRRNLSFEEFVEDDRFDEEDEDSVTDDTLEFLSLDDEAIEAYQSGHKASSARFDEDPADDDEDYEDEDEDDEEDDEDYEVDDEEDEDDDEDYEVDDEEDEDDDEDYEVDDEDYEVDDEEDEDDEDYDVDEDDDEDYEDEDDDYDDEGGVLVRFKRYLAQMSTLDMIVAMLGIVVIAGVIISGSLYVNAKTVAKQVETFAAVGEQVEGISVIGESGLVAVSESARLASMIDLEEPEDVAQEQEDQDKGIEVTINLTSVQSDLKIKFVNKATGKLIGGVPFAVEVSNGKKTFELKDDDKDGIIYQTGLEAGTYKVTAKLFKEGEYDDYILPAAATSVKVTDTIAYKKVEVQDEVKTEAEVNAAVEDTAKQDTAQESALQDTVEWVESTKTPLNSDDNYQEIGKDTIPDPATFTLNASGILNRIAANNGMMLLAATGPDSCTCTVQCADAEAGQNSGCSVCQNDHTQCSPRTAETCICGADDEKCTESQRKEGCTVCQNDYTQCQGTKQPAEPPECICDAGGVKCTADKKQRDDCEACKANIEACKGKGTAETPKTCTCQTKCSKDSVDASCEVCKDDFNACKGTEAAAKPVSYTITITDCPATMTVGGTAQAVATTDPAGGTIKWSTNDANILAIEESTGKMTAKAAGKATITANCDNAAAAATKEVTVENVKYTAIAISGANSVNINATASVSGKTTPEGGAISWTSSDESILKIESQNATTANFKGIKAGEATITAKCGDASSTWKVTVVNDKRGDNKTLLKDKNGNQVYVKQDGQFRQATYADYYVDGMKFYLQRALYFYTGWQTIDGSVYFFDKNGNYVTGDQVIQGAKYTFGSDGRLSSGSGSMGIDVSKWNGNIDWNAVKNSGVSYVIIRCGYRGSSTGALIEDPKFRSNIKGAKAAGLKVGLYFFSQAVNEVEAVEEASMAVGLASGYGLNYPIFLDVESSGGRGDGVSKEMRTAVCKAFCATVQNSGYSAGVYANKTWFTEKINTGSLTGYKIWLAQYASAPTYTATKYDMWQYSSKGKVSGISGNVDMNISYMGY